MAKLIGTAGHVDHGKTTLIRALTGIDADRFPEEKKRGMTIDVGFAYIDLPNAGRVSIVDLPGHERFIGNMLVGASAIDVALLCIAADDGVMPQTIEHFQILDLLPVESMVVAVTRSDLATDDTMELVELQIGDLLRGTRFENAPIVRVAATTGIGLDSLRDTLDTALSQERAERTVEGRWYMPIDRVFTIKGQGCVVTGSLARNEVQVGSTGMLLPRGTEVRIRQMHSHAVPIEIARPGMRVSMNLTGVKSEDVERGMAVGSMGAIFESNCFEAKVRWVAECRHAETVRISIGTAEVIGRVFKSKTNPAHVQFRTTDPIAVALGQPIIFRKHSPPQLLGGGIVNVPQSKPRGWQNAALETDPGSKEPQLVELIESRPTGISTEEVCRLLGRTAQELGDRFETAKKSGAIAGFAGQWISKGNLDALAERLTETLGELHAKNPTSLLVPRDEVVKRAQLPWTGKPLDRLFAYLEESGIVANVGTGVRLPTFTLQLTDRQQKLIERVKAELEKQDVLTPSPFDLAKSLGVPIQAVEEILKLGHESKSLVLLEGGVAYTPVQIQRLMKRAQEAFQERPFAASEFRDAIGASRKYVIPLLEHFDKLGFTLRVGDKRFIKKR